jgi:hypothetical protein
MRICISLIVTLWAWTLAEIAPPPPRLQPLPPGVGKRVPPCIAGRCAAAPLVQPR